MDVQWHDHHRYEGQHAFLSPSKPSWLNYDEEHLVGAYRRSQAAQRGTYIHDFAARCVTLKQKLPSNGLAGRKTLNHYVNDAVKLNMKPEQILFYSPNCFGTADTISYRDGVLRIHDLKTGVTPTHIEQLLVYASLFCLEYEVDPERLNGCELCIYQSDDILLAQPDPVDIRGVMNRIVHFDRIIEQVRSEDEV